MLKVAQLVRGEVGPKIQTSLTPKASEHEREDSYLKNCKASWRAVVSFAVLDLVSGVCPGNPLAAALGSFPFLLLTNKVVALVSDPFGCK